MVDIDEILAGAIRTAWLEISGPESRTPHHTEVETARRIRQALEREGIIITRSRRRAVTANFTRCRTLGTFRIRRSEREARRRLCHEVIFYKPEEDGAAAPTAGST